MKKNTYIAGFVLLLGVLFYTSGSPVSAQTYRVVSPTFTCLSKQPCTTPTPTLLPTGLTNKTFSTNPCTSQTRSFRKQRNNERENNRFLRFIQFFLLRLFARAGIPIPPSLMNPCTPGPIARQPLSPTYPVTTAGPASTAPGVTNPPTSSTAPQPTTPGVTTRPVSTVAPGSSTGPINASCTPAGIGALADQIATEFRKACTSEGTGVITKNNATCMKATLERVLPSGAAAYKDAYSVVQNYNPYQCVNFTATVTQAACGNLLLAIPGGADAREYSGRAVNGYKWMAKNSGQIQVGDIPVYTGGQFGHIMIVVEVLDSNHVRLAEANQVSDGEVSNSRIDTLDNSVMTGWQRKL